MACATLRPADPAYYYYYYTAELRHLKNYNYITIYSQEEMHSYLLFKNTYKCERSPVNQSIVTLPDLSYDV